MPTGRRSRTATRSDYCECKDDVRPRTIASKHGVAAVGGPGTCHLDVPLRHGSGYRKKMQADQSSRRRRRWIFPV